MMIIKSISLMHRHTCHINALSPQVNCNFLARKKNNQMTLSIYVTKYMPFSTHTAHFVCECINKP